MVQGIGGMGSGSIRNIPAYQQFYSMYLQSGSNVSFTSWLQMKGYDDAFYQEIENYFETGDPCNGNDSKKTLDGTKYVSSGRTALFQGEDDDTFYEFDWATGSYTVIQGKDTVAEMLGLPAGTNYDTLNFEFGKVTITDYIYGNPEDGQDATSYTVTGSKYGSKVTYVAQEFDLDYVFNALLNDKSDPQYIIAMEIFEKLVENMDQWLPVEAQQELDKFTEGYHPNTPEYDAIVSSAEYKAKLKEYMIEFLYQPGEWIEGHKHLEKTSSLTDPAFRSEDGSDASTSGDGKVPVYKNSDVLNGAGIDSEYRANQMWCGDWYEKGKKEETKAQASTDAYNMIKTLCSYMANSLKASVGDAWTEEMDEYLETLEEHMLNGFFVTSDEDICDDGRIKKNGVWATTDCKGGAGGDFRAVISYKNFADEYLKEFNNLCKNKGKTSEEITADQKADKEKRAKEKDAYKTLYNMNMKSTASEAGVKDSYQVVNVSSAAEIQAKAESDIIKPLIAQIKSKLAGKEITESDLDAILEYATEYALANPTGWASTENNYVYTINSSKVIEKFEEAVKKGVKQKGFDF